MDIQMFNFGDKEIRTMLSEEGQPLFCAKDVAEALGYTNPRKAIGDHCKGVTKRYPLETAGGTQKIRFITEGDVYRLIFNSKLEGAQKFEAWIVDTVIPTIRKDGVFMTPEAAEKILYNPDFIIGLASRVKELQTELEASQLALEASQLELEQSKPARDMGELFLTSKTEASLSDVANYLASSGYRIPGDNRVIGRNRLAAWLRQNRFVQQGSPARPFQIIIEQGLATFHPGIYTDRYGNQHQTGKMFLTPRGVQWIQKRLSRVVEISDYIEA